MSFYLVKECEADFPFDDRALAKQIVSFCLEHEKFPYGAEVSLTLTDNAGICAINKEYRQIDQPTDVLSFPMLWYEAPGVFDFLQENCEDSFNPDTGEVILGDIIISVDKVAEQAKSYGHSLQREFAFLIVHSMLHLFGYDHMEPEDASLMEQKQCDILEAMNIPR